MFTSNRSRIGPQHLFLLCLLANELCSVALLAMLHAMALLDAAEQIGQCYTSLGSSQNSKRSRGEVNSGVDGVVKPSLSLLKKCLELA